MSQVEVEAQSTRLIEISWVLTFRVSTPYILTDDSTFSFYDKLALYEGKFYRSSDLVFARNVAILR